MNLSEASSTFAMAVLCVATLRLPSTGSRSWLRGREVCAEYQQLDLYEGRDFHSLFLSSEMGLFRTFGGAGLLTPLTPVGGGDQTWRGHTHSA